MRAVRKHTDCPWVLLYIERWLKAPDTDGGWKPHRKRTRTPQGGVISPLLSISFCIIRSTCGCAGTIRTIPFERYADDVICHCRSEEQARTLRASLEKRFAECGLTLHPEKTKIVYCKDDDRRGDYPDHKFDFLGYTFQAEVIAPMEWVRRLVQSSGQRQSSQSRSGRLFAAGRSMSAATSRLMIWRGCSTLISAAGSTIMAVSTSRLFTRPFGTSTASWRDGLIGSSSP